MTKIPTPTRGGNWLWNGRELVDLDQQHQASDPSKRAAGSPATPASSRPGKPTDRKPRRS